MTPRPGLRERKKQATRQALRSAALRLALERGPENVRVDDIADAAGVSPRTYNNYFSSREQAIVAAVTAEREARIAAAVATRLDGVTLAGAVIDAVVAEYADPGDDARDAVLMITASPALRTCYVDSVTGIEEHLATALVQRNRRLDRLSARVLAASVAATVKVALHEWMRPVPARSGNRDLVVVSGSLPDLMRTALASLAPALDAAAASAAAPGSPPTGPEAT